MNGADALKARLGLKGAPSGTGRYRHSGMVSGTDDLEQEPTSLPRGPRLQSAQKNEPNEWGVR